MKTLSKTAELHLNSYLRHVRKYLQASESVDANEVERDILDHVESELEQADDPVSLNEMNRVLKELGNPSQWIPMDDMSWWRQMHFKIKIGAKEHPWAYRILSFIVIVYGVLLFIPIMVIIGRMFVFVIGLLIALVCLKKLMD